MNGSRIATSVGGVITGLGTDIIIIDDPLKPEEALSEVRLKGAKEWIGQTIFSRLGKASSIFPRLPRKCNQIANYACAPRKSHTDLPQSR